MFRRRQKAGHVVEIITDCISPHVSKVREGYMQLVWRRTSEIKERARVVAWTCHCRSIMYELCRAGGQSYIRRTEYDKSGETVYETYRWSFTKASEVWAALLEGRTL